MPPRTAWSNRSSLISDRIKPHAPQISRTTNVSNNKEKAVAKEAPKSAEGIALESIISKLRNITEASVKKDPKGGCFCLARTHALSKYTSLCLRCGLILCEVNLPYHACPHCSKPLLADFAREKLIEELEVRVNTTIANEIAAAEEAAIKAQEAAGSFPALGSNNQIASAPGTIGGPGSVQARPTPAATQAHKVLSLQSKTKKVTMTSYKPIPPPLSRTVSQAEKEKEAVIRVPPPLKEVEYVKVEPGKEIKRPYADQSGNGPVYIPPRRIDEEAGTSNEGKKKRNKKKKESTGQPP